MLSLESHLSIRAGIYVTLVILISFVLSLIVARDTLQEFPNSADEYVYVYQAETLSKGNLWQPSHPRYDFFHFNHIAQKNEIRVGRFPPGWPMILTIAFVLNIPPFLVNPILGLLGLVFFFVFARDIYDKKIAFWSVISLSLTGYYIFNSASFFSHTSCLLYAIGFIYGIYLYERKKSIKYALTAGAFLGMMVISRYYTAALILFPIAVYLLLRYKWKAIPVLTWTGVACVPFVIFLFWYNLSITGNGLLPVTMWINNEEALGFVQGHTFFKGVEHIIRRFFMFLYWCSPALIFLYVIFIFQKSVNKTDRRVHTEDYIFILLIIGYFFYHHIGGNQYGPRFLLEGLPFLIVFVVRKIFQIQAKWAFALFFAGLIYGAVKLPFIMEREQGIVTERLDLYRLAHEQNISNAVILISSTTGIIRPMPVRDLTRNGMDYNGSIIYAQDLPDKNPELMKYYPGRDFYRYIRDPEEVRGKLVKVR